MATIKRFTIRGRVCYGIWKKGHRGFVSLIYRKKGITLRSIRESVSKGKRKRFWVIPTKRPENLFRITQTVVYSYEAFERVGQLRVEVCTKHPKLAKYRYKTLHRRLQAINRRLLAKYPDYRRKFNKWVHHVEYKAREEHLIEPDEKRRQAGVIFYDLVGFGQKTISGRVYFDLADFG